MNSLLSLCLAELPVSTVIGPLGGLMANSGADGGRGPDLARWLIKASDGHRLESLFKRGNTHEKIRSLYWFVLECLMAKIPPFELKLTSHLRTILFSSHSDVFRTVTLPSRRRPKKQLVITAHN